MKSLARNWNLLDQFFYTVESELNKSKEENTLSDQEMLEVIEENYWEQLRQARERDYPRKIRKEADQFFCPFCSLSVQANWSYCPSCGGRIYCDIISQATT